MTTSIALGPQVKSQDLNFGLWRQILGTLGADRQVLSEDAVGAIDGIYVYQAVCQGVDKYRKLRLQS